MGRNISGIPAELYVITITQTRLIDDPELSKPAYYDHPNMHAGYVSVHTLGPYAVKQRAKQEFNKTVKNYATGHVYQAGPVWTPGEVKFLITKTNWIEGV